VPRPAPGRRLCCGALMRPARPARAARGTRSYDILAPSAADRRRTDVAHELIVRRPPYVPNVIGLLRYDSTYVVCKSTVFGVPCTFRTRNQRSPSSAPIDRRGV
jgi:hypothetical protein